MSIQNVLKDLKKRVNRMRVLGTHWPDYRDWWLAPTQEQRPDRVLDAGCGRGEVAQEFRRAKVQIDYMGVDLGVGDPSWEFRVSAVADLHRLPFQSASFDKVICNQVLEHVDDPVAVLGELARVLRQGGRLYLSVPFIWHLHQEPYDRFRFSSHVLEKMLAQVGLSARLQPMGGYFSVLRYVLMSHGLVTESLPSALRAVLDPGLSLLRKTDAYVFAPVWYALDKLDRDRKLTLGYFVEATKGSSATALLPADPYRCPVCALDEAQLTQRTSRWTCSRCGAAFEVLAGVPVLTPKGSYTPVTDRISFSG